MPGPLFLKLELGGGGVAHYLKQKKWKIENKVTVKNLRDYENLGGIDWRRLGEMCGTMGKGLGN